MKRSMKVGVMRGPNVRRIHPVGKALPCRRIDVDPWMYGCGTPVSTACPELSTGWSTGLRVGAALPWMRKGSVVCVPERPGVSLAAHALALEKGREQHSGPLAM